MSIMHYNGCFSHQTTTPRISANGLSREIYFRTPTSTRTTAVRRGVLLQDVGVCGGRRNLDQIGGVNPCVLVALRHGFSSLPYCFNSCNVYGRSSSYRRRLWSKLAAFEDSTTPNVPVVQGVVLQDAGEDEELPIPTSENGSSIASFAQEKVSSTTGYWSSLPPRYKLVLTTSLAMVICNMDKVNFCCKTDGHHGVICCVCFFSWCVFLFASPDLFCNLRTREIGEQFYAGIFHFELEISALEILLLELPSHILQAKI